MAPSENLPEMPKSHFQTGDYSFSPSAYKGIHIVSDSVQACVFSVHIIVHGSCVNTNVHKAMFSFLVKGGQYVVVKFPEEDDSVAIVHKKWMNGNFCMWPPEMKNIHSLLISGVTPGPEWMQLPCIEVQAFGNIDFNVYLLTVGISWHPFYVVNVCTN